MLTLKNYQENALESLKRYFQLTHQLQNADTAFYQTTQENFGRGIPYNPVKNLHGLPYICLRLPTGAGKTLVACHSLSIAKNILLHADTAVVLWLVPSNTIREQTLEALKDNQHPYRQALDATLGSVAVLDISDSLHVKRATLDTETTIIISTIQAFRVDDTEGRKVYETNGSLMDHFTSVPEGIRQKMDCCDDGKPKPTLANVLCLRSPIVIVDEAHNARTGLSFEMLTRFNPSCIIEYTATPDVLKNPSNVLYSASASELYSEDMIKMPIHLTTRSNWKEILTDAIGQRNELAEIANEEQRETGEYIRPLMLIQAQPKRKNEETITFEAVKKCLMEDFRIPESHIAISTGTTDELKDIDVAGPDCEYRYIITVQKLREGWDCPFAYVLCSLATMKSPTAVEQIVGRILRLPGAIRKQGEKLNSAYAYAVSSNFEMVLKNMTDALIQNGFERQEAKDFISQKNTEQEELPFENDPLFSDKTTVKIPDIKPDHIQGLPQKLKDKITIDEKNETLTYNGSMSLNDKETLEKNLPSPEGKEAVEKIFKRKRQVVTDIGQTPSEKGIPFEIPALAVKQGDLFEIYEEQHFLDDEWILSKCKADLPAFTGKRSQGKRGKINVKNGKIQAEYLAHIQEKYETIFNKKGWNEAQLVHWLDMNIQHPDISPEETGIFIASVVRKLLNDEKLTLEYLLMNKYNLRDAIEKRINEHRKNAHKQIHQQNLFGDNSKVLVTPEVCFSFQNDRPHACPYNRIYNGKYKFKNHYYPKVGDFGSGEEEECAIHLDQSPEIAHWVRNFESNARHGFWLQTATDKFYPDFVCLLKDGRYFVVEHKGYDRSTNADSSEKRLLGELWEKRSNGKCLFVMTQGKNFEVIDGKMG